MHRIIYEAPVKDMHQCRPPQSVTKPINSIASCTYCGQKYIQRTMDDKKVWNKLRFYHIKGQLALRKIEQ